MLPATWDLAPTSKMNGSAARGAPLSPINQSPTQNYSDVVASHIWGPQFLFLSDNEVVVHVLMSRTLKFPCIMQLLRHLLSVSAQYNFTFTAIHLPGIHNLITDALLRFHWQEFQRLAPEALPHPAPIPQQLWDLLISPPQRCSATIFCMCMGWHPLPATRTLQVRKSSMSFALSFIRFIHWVLLARLTNGRHAFLRHSWPMVVNGLV